MKTALLSVYGDETGQANQMLVEVDQQLWDTIVALHARSKELGAEFSGTVEIGLSARGHAVVLNDLDSDECQGIIPDSVYDWLRDLDSCSWFEGDPEDIRKMIAAMEAVKEETGRDYDTQPATLDAERLVVETIGEHWSCHFRFALRKSDVDLESADLCGLFTLPT